MILFKVSLSLYLIYYHFFLILDPFYLNVSINTTLTTLSCMTEAKVNLSSVCQRCCTKEKVPEEKALANHAVLLCGQYREETREYGHMAAL